MMPSPQNAFLKPNHLRRVRFPFWKTWVMATNRPIRRFFSTTYHFFHTPLRMDFSTINHQGESK